METVWTSYFVFFTSWCPIKSLENAGLGQRALIRAFVCIRKRRSALVRIIQIKIPVHVLCSLAAVRSEQGNKFWMSSNRLFVNKRNSFAKEVTNASSLYCPLKFCFIHACSSYVHQSSLFQQKITQKKEI